MNNSIHLKLTPSISFIFMSFAVQPHQNSGKWILAQRSWVASRNLCGGEAKSAKLLRMFDFTRCNFIRSAAVTNEALVGKPLWPPLLETFLWKSPSPVTGLQKCNQQSYVLFARSSSLRAASSNFQSRKVGGKRTQEEDFSTSGFWRIFSAEMRSFHHERIYFTKLFSLPNKFPNTQFNSAADSILYAEGKSCHGEKCFQFFEICLLLLDFLRCWRGLVMHWFQSTSKTFFQVLLRKYVNRVFQNKSWS